MKLPPIENCDRVQYILDACKGKKVLHVGCSDWPYTEDRMRDGTWLHAAITSVASEALGVDIEPEGIARLHALGITNVVALDASRPLFDELQQTFDVVVAGEVIEHVLNAGEFLASIQSVMTPDSILVLTTVNYCPIKRVVRLVNRYENVHEDHVCYYSRATLGKLMDMMSYDVVDWKVHWWDVGRLSRLVNPLLRRLGFMRYYADTLCLTAKKRGR